MHLNPIINREMEQIITKIISAGLLIMNLNQLVTHSQGIITILITLEGIQIVIAMKVLSMSY